MSETLDFSYTKFAEPSPIATGEWNKITAKQIGYIRLLCRQHNLEPCAESQAMFGCDIDELSQSGASRLIYSLKDR